MDYLGTRKALFFRDMFIVVVVGTPHVRCGTARTRETERDRRKRSAVKQSAKETGEERERNTNNV